MNLIFSRVGVVARRSSPHIGTPLQKLVDLLRAQMCERIVFDAETAREHPVADVHSAPPEQLGQQVDLVIVLGGDGTMLSIARLVVADRIPLIGINQGHLGFLTDIPVESMGEKLPPILQGRFITEARTLMQATLVRQGQDIDGADCHRALAVNDVVFSRGALGTMIEFEVYVDQQFVYRQRSDGLIVNTPTGSTAYALASGGPILHPTLSAFTLVPVCPQTMSARPIAVNDNATLEVVLIRGPDSRVHFDGQSHRELQEKDRVIIRRHADHLRFLHPLDHDYYDTLRRKLHWGAELF